MEEAEVDEAGEDSAFFEEVGADAVNGDAFVGFAGGEDGTLFSVNGAGGDDGDMWPRETRCSVQSARCWAVATTSG